MDWQSWLILLPTQFSLLTNVQSCRHCWLRILRRNKTNNTWTPLKTPNTTKSWLVANHATAVPVSTVLSTLHSHLLSCVCVVLHPRHSYSQYTSCTLQSPASYKSDHEKAAKTMQTGTRIREPEKEMIVAFYVFMVSSWINPQYSSSLPLIYCIYRIKAHLAITSYL